MKENYPALTKQFWFVAFEFNRQKRGKQQEKILRKHQSPYETRRASWASAEQQLHAAS